MNILIKFIQRKGALAGCTEVGREQPCEIYVAKGSIGELYRTRAETTLLNSFRVTVH
jgi:hypothetical protein